MSKASGKKRASPGAEGAGESSLAIELSDDQVKQLEQAQKAVDLMQVSCLITGLKKMDPIYAKRRTVVKDIPGFWPTALFHHKFVEMAAEHAADKDALSYLEDVWVARNESEPRAYKMEFHFKENPYFSNQVLVKDYSYVAPPNVDPTVDEYGLTAAQRDFDEERDIKPLSASIDWKNESKNLVHLYPRKMDVDDENELQDTGSFFNWFTEEGDEFGTGSYLMDVFEDGIKYFLGQVDDFGEDDLTDSEEEDEEGDDEEIDLEQPKKKARKA